MDNMVSKTKSGVSDQKTYRKTLRKRINQRGQNIMVMIGLYFVTSVFDMCIQPNSRLWITLSLAVLTTAILASIARLVYTIFLRGIAKGLLANIPLVFLAIAWIFKAVALSYTIH